MSEASELVFDFFKKFSSFENVLRGKGLVRIQENGVVCWNDLKNELKKNNFSFTTKQKELTILRNPPKVPRFKKGDITPSWEEGAIGIEDQELAVNVLVRVRSNLFHGSKHFVDSTEGERNFNLVSDALVVLDEVIKCIQVEDDYEDVLDYWETQVIS